MLYYCIDYGNNYNEQYSTSVIKDTHNTNTNVVFVRGFWWYRRARQQCRQRLQDEPPDDRVTADWQPDQPRQERGAERRVVLGWLVAWSDLSTEESLNRTDSMKHLRTKVRCSCSKSPKWDKRLSFLLLRGKRTVFCTRYFLECKCVSVIKIYLHYETEEKHFF